MTVKFPVLNDVAKAGPSVDTSHLYWPVLVNERSINRIEFSLLDIVCKKK